MNNNQRQGLLYGSFVADVLSLGSHWIYKPEQIESDIKDISTFCDPISMYHPTKKKGDFTHYGDMLLFLLDFMKNNSDLTKDNFKKRIYTAWSEFISNYTGYLDGGNRDSLENYKNGADISGQSKIDDLIASVRLAPFIYFIDDMDTLKEFCAIQSQMTHNVDKNQVATLLTLELLLSVTSGTNPKKAIKDLLKNDKLSLLHPHINRALECKEEDIKAIYSFGETSPACHINGALEGSLVMISRYENDFEKAMIQNTKAGGDNSARGIFIGLILGAYLGVDAIPKKWIDGMNAKDKISSLI